MTALRALWVTEPTLRGSTGDASELDPALPLEVALRYATAMGWAVAPGCHQGLGGRRCGRPDCFLAGPHPVAELAGTTGSRDDATLFRWWHRHPTAPVLLATGRSFDVLDVPAYAAAEALRRLKLTGLRLGPIARDADRRLLIWLVPSSARCADLMDRRPWASGDLDLHRRRAGEYVPAPPFQGAQWTDPPVPYTHRVLPRCDDLLGAVVEACREGAPVTSSGLAGEAGDSTAGPYRRRQGDR